MAYPKIVLTSSFNKNVRTGGCLMFKLFKRKDTQNNQSKTGDLTTFYKLFTSYKEYLQSRYNFYKNKDKNIVFNYIEPLLKLHSTITIQFKKVLSIRQDAQKSYMVFKINRDKHFKSISEFIAYTKKGNDDILPESVADAKNSYLDKSRTLEVLLSDLKRDIKLFNDKFTEFLEKDIKRGYILEAGKDNPSDVI